MGLRITPPLFIFFSIAISIADIKTGEVPRAAFLAAFGCLLALRTLAGGSRPPWGALAGLSLGIAVFALALAVSGGGLGWADVWYSGLIGLVLGPAGWYPAIAIACAAALLFMIVTRRRRIPFIPFMAAGSVSACFLRGWPQ
jgi:prepilin signal peptidase PulO-like enzyme (type II secretory pathway)